MPSNNKINSCTNITAEGFCECIGGKIINKTSDQYCKILLTSHNLWDYYCQNIPTPQTHPECTNRVKTQLSSYAPRYDSHIISGRIYAENISDIMIAVYKPNKPKEIILDQQIIGNFYQIDTAYFPSGWNVDDIIIISVYSKNMPIITKNVVITNTAQQNEDIII